MTRKISAFSSSVVGRPVLNFSINRAMDSPSSLAMTCRIRAKASSCTTSSAFELGAIAAELGSPSLAPRLCS
jgi:hypothetical protein